MKQAAWLKTQPAPMSIKQCLAYADQTLSGPPKKSHIERAEPRGVLLGRFVVQPLSLLPAVNVFKDMKPWMRTRVRDKAKAFMLPQLAAVRSMKTLPGRPMVRAIRFSSSEPDHDNAWTKVAIDRLVEFRIVQDDRPSMLNLKSWWEEAPRGQGFCYFEIWSGDSP